MHTAMPAQRSIDRVARIKASASGRWREIFVRFGLAEAHLKSPIVPVRFAVDGIGSLFLHEKPMAVGSAADADTATVLRLYSER